MTRTTACRHVPWRFIPLLTPLPLLLAILIVSPGRALCAPPPEGAPSPPPPADGRAVTVSSLAERYSSAPCAGCHREIFDQWKGSGHASSLFGGGRTAAGFRRAVREGLMAWPFSGVREPKDVKGGHLSGCARCHAPQLAEGSDEVARELASSFDAWQDARDRGDGARADAEAAKLSSLNVGCLVCHGRNALVHRWTDGPPAAGAVYGSKEGSHPGAYPAMKASPVMRESILCGQCHGTGPSFEHENPSQCATAYGSWLFGYRSEGGLEECQGCHMGPGAGHGMAGRVPGGGDPVAVAWEARAYLWRDGDRYVPRVAVDVELRNRAGHSLPDGPFPDRHLLLEVTAADRSGAELFRRTRTFGPVPRRAGGDGPAAAPHEATGLLSDGSLPAGRPVRERFDVFFPPLGEGVSVPGPVSLRLRLLRSGDFAGAGAGKPLQDLRREISFDGRH